MVRKKAVNHAKEHKSQLNKTRRQHLENINEMTLEMMPLSNLYHF